MFSVMLQVAIQCLSHKKSDLQSFHACKSDSVSVNHYRYIGRLPVDDDDDEKSKLNPSVVLLHSELTSECLRITEE